MPYDITHLGENVEHLIGSCIYVYIYCKYRQKGTDITCLKGEFPIEFVTDFVSEFLIDFVMAFVIDDFEGEFSNKLFV